MLGVAIFNLVVICLWGVFGGRARRRMAEWQEAERDREQAEWEAARQAFANRSTAGVSSYRSASGRNTERTEEEWFQD